MRKAFYTPYVIFTFFNHMKDFDIDLDRLKKLFSKHRKGSRRLSYQKGGSEFVGDVEQMKHPGKSIWFSGKRIQAARTEVGPENVEWFMLGSTVNSLHRIDDTGHLTQ